MTTYDFKKVPNYSKRQMFLDPAGPVTIQRYDEFAYPFIRKFTQTQKGFFWVPEEITLVKDKIDFKEANEAVRHIFTSNLLRQTALDSIQGRAPEQVFKPVCSVPELEALVQWWSAFEQIHSEAYSHIIRNIYNVPSDEFNRIHETEEIISMAANIGRYYDALHILNCSKELGGVVEEQDHIDAIWMALNASYALEAIRFMVSFATSLGMVENKIFIGNGNEISLILQDELLHTDWTAQIINRVVKDDPRFAAAKKRCDIAVMEMFNEVIREEKEWAKYLFKKGTVLGMNEAIMCSHVDYTAQLRLKEIGLKYDAGVKSPPLPWFNKHMNTSKKQTALQENESVSYVIGAMTNHIDYDDLPTI